MSVSDPRRGGATGGANPLGVQRAGARVNLTLMSDDRTEEVDVELEEINRHSKLIFILGYHRSGTTILYNMLLAAGPFCHPSPYHLAHFEGYLADEQFDQERAIESTMQRFASQGIVDRFVDHIPAGALSAEEYGFALREGRLTSSNLKRFMRFGDFVRSRAGDGQVLLLKNPRDFDNALFIHRSFPRAKFIFIHRHPGPTIDSRIRELRLLFNRRSPYQAEIEPRYGRIMDNGLLRGSIRLCLRPQGMLTRYFLHDFRRSGKRFLGNLASMAAGAHISLTYEKLCADPEGEVGRVLEFLGLGGCDTSRVRNMILPVPRPPSSNSVLHSARAARLLRPYLEHCGYHGLWPEGPATI